MWEKKSLHSVSSQVGRELYYVYDGSIRDEAVTGGIRRTSVLNKNRPEDPRVNPSLIERKNVEW
jgi:hypothetical protein